MNYIPYYRVSTAKQGRSGLGLEAQQSIIKAYIESKGGTILQEFTEVESGKSRTRPELQKAVALSASEKAILIVAKLDRLARDAEFAFMVNRMAHEIVCCDFPSGNKLLFGMLAVLGEYERQLISERTKAAWDAKKARGYVHTPKTSFTQEMRDASVKVRKDASQGKDAYKQARAFALTLKGEGLQVIADKLNALNYKTPRGGSYHKESVRRLLL